MKGCKGSYRNQCPNCYREVKRKYYQKNIEKITKQHQIYRNTHKEDSQKYCKQYYSQHKKSVNQKSSIYYQQLNLCFM